MFGYVVKRLLDNAIDCRFDIGSEPAHVLINGNAHLHSGGFGEVFGFFADCGYKPELLEDEWRKARDNAPNALDGAIHD